MDAMKLGYISYRISTREVLIYRMRVKINERRNGSPVIYFQILWGFCHYTTDAFKIIAENQHPS